MRRILILVLAILAIASSASAQVMQTYPRMNLTFNGSTTNETLNFGGWLRWRTSGATPAVSAAGEMRLYFDGTNWKISQNGGAYVNVVQAGVPGTVTSVGLSLTGGLFTVSGSPVTTTGTLTGTMNTQAINTVFAGGASGGAATPTFRALVTNDIPSLDAAKITTGTFGAGRVDTTSILDATILFADWAANGCAANQIAKRNAGNTAWVCAADDTSVGGTSWVTAGNALAATGVFGSTNAFDLSFVTNNVQRALWSQSTGTLSFINTAGGSAPDAIEMLPSVAASAGTPLVDSSSAAFTARYWNGSSSTARTFRMFTDVTATTPTSTLTIRSPTSNDVTFSDGGSINMTGTLSSDRTGDQNIISGTSVQQIQGGILNLISRASAPGAGASEGKLYMNSADDHIYVNEAGTGWRLAFPITAPTQTYIQWGANQGIGDVTLGATADVRNNTPVLTFADAATEVAYFVGIMPEQYDGGDFTVHCRWTTTGTTGNMRIGHAIEADPSGSGAGDIDVDSFGTEQITVMAAAATSGVISNSSSTMNTAAIKDSVAAGDFFRLRIRRIGADGTDTATTDGQLLGCQIRK